MRSRFGDSPLAPHQPPESSLAAENHFSLRIEILGSLKHAQFTCPSHQASLNRLADKVVVSHKQEQAAMDRDFILTVKALKASRSFAVCEAADEGGGGGGKFSAILSRPATAPATQPRRRDRLFQVIAG